MIGLLKKIFKFGARKIGVSSLSVSSIVDRHSREIVSIEQKMKAAKKDAAKLLAERSEAMKREADSLIERELLLQKKRAEAEVELELATIAQADMM